MSVLDFRAILKHNTHFKDHITWIWVCKLSFFSIQVNCLELRLPLLDLQTFRRSKRPLRKSRFFTKYEQKEMIEKQQEIKKKEMSKTKSFTCLWFKNNRLGLPNLILVELCSSNSLIIKVNTYIYNIHIEFSSPKIMFIVRRTNCINVA